MTYFGLFGGQGLLTALHGGMELGVLADLRLFAGSGNRTGGRFQGQGISYHLDSLDARFGCFFREAVLLRMLAAFAALFGKPFPQLFCIACQSPPQEIGVATMFF